MNDLLKRGALLHADLAMLAPQRARQFSGLSSWTSDQAIESSDGQALGARVVSGHWRFARTLLARVQPNPARDDTVRVWYAAVAAYLQREREHAVAYQHLEDARRLLRADPQVWFYSGVLHETFASPSMQEAASGGRRTAIQPRRVELDAAARYLNLVVRADPALVEARLRHGRVLHLLGRHERAVAELQTVRDAVQEGALKYYAELYLGAAHEALGRWAEARLCFERAAALQPTAQSPLLALSHLARQAGDRAKAVRFIEQVMALPSDPDGRDDPLWSYDVAALGDVGQLLATLRAPFLTGDRP
jgi:tetratricopeptide (TPR) repeat protein